MPDSTVSAPTDRPPRQRPADAIQVAPLDVERYGAAGAIVLAAIVADGKLVTTADLAVRTGLDSVALPDALFELVTYRRVQTDYRGTWWLRPDDALDDLRAHVEATTAGAELEASNIPVVDQ